MNFEAVFTVLLGWLWFHEHIGRRVGGALVLMALGGAFLIQNASVGGLGWGAVAVLGHPHAPDTHHQHRH